jgi:ferredoxin
MSEVDMLFTRTTDDVPSHNSPWFFSIDDLRPGACGGELACSTCHLIFPKDVYDTLPPMEDDEVDMLDLAFEVTETSRLGCQIKVRKDMAGMKVRDRATQLERVSSLSS